MYRTNAATDFGRHHPLNITYKWLPIPANRPPPDLLLDFSADFDGLRVPPLPTRLLVPWRDGEGDVDDGCRGSPGVEC